RFDVAQLVDDRGSRPTSLKEPSCRRGMDPHNRDVVGDNIVEFTSDVHAFGVYCCCSNFLVCGSEFSVGLLKLPALFGPMPRLATKITGREIVPEGQNQAGGHIVEQLTGINLG